MRRPWLILLFLAMGFLATAQPGSDLDRTSIIEQRIEQIAEAAEDENLDYNTLFEQLSIYFDFPLNLNAASAEDMYSLGLLSNFQVIQFMEYRREYNQLLSIYELPQIAGWDAASADLIAPFVVVKPVMERERITFESLRKYGKHEVVVRWQRILEDQAGYAPISPEELADRPNARYLGSPEKLFMRYRYRFGDRISFGFTGEKDNGEEFFQRTQKQGFDFYSAHLFLKDFGRLQKLAVGDYQAQFGQGLTFWSGLGFNRKSSFTTSIAQSGRGITPYTSINENLFLRGGAATTNLGKFTLTGFYSGKFIDGNIVAAANDSLDLVEQELVVSSFQESGFHRTQGEFDDKNAIFQQHYGGNLGYRNTNLQLGFTAVHTEVDGGLDRSLQAYSQFRANSSANSAMGGDYTWKVRNFLFFGETARSANGAIATLNSVNINMASRLSINVTQRYYAPDFQPVASIGFGEGSQVENESGVYLGAEFRPFKKWKVNVFFDQFKFPWLRFQVDAPSSGYDFLAQLDYQPSSRLSVYLRYRDRNRQINTREDFGSPDFLVDNPRRNLRLNFSYRATNQIRLRSRIEVSESGRGDEPVARGFLIYQDFLYDFTKVPLSFTMRYALFDTDGYDARLYAYENDVLYFFSIPAHSGRGTRVYAMLKYELGRNIDIWLRWAQFYYTDRNEVGTGLEAINGNTRSDVRVQMRWTF